MKKISPIFVNLFLVVVFVKSESPVPSPYGRLALKSRQTPSADSRIVDQRLLDRVADIFNSGGDGSESGPQDMEGYSIVGADLFERIARIISQNEGQTSLSAPVPQGPAITSDYGVPPEVGSRLVGGDFEIGKPEPARRIAYFELTEDDNSLGGGYSMSNNNNAYTSSAYPSIIGGGGGRFMFLSDPKLSERIAAFEIPDSTPPLVNSGY